MTRCQSDRRILPELDLLRQILSYDPATGYITYLDRPNDMFSSDRAANSWRTQYLGERAGSNITRDGRTYCQIELFNVKYNAHRLAWKIYYGEDPPDIIDHIDGDGSNNKIENLRAATIFQNGWNAKKSSRNKSGYKGVSFNTQRNKWRAAIHVNKKTILIGYYSTPQEASEAYQKASAAYHGEFYNPT